MNAVEWMWVSSPELHAAQLTERSVLQAEDEALDVDHFILNEEGDCLGVNPKWLQYLQVTPFDGHTVASRRASNADLFSLHEKTTASRSNPSGCRTSK